MAVVVRVPSRIRLRFEQEIVHHDAEARRADGLYEEGDRAVADLAYDVGVDIRGYDKCWHIRADLFADIADYVGPEFPTQAVVGDDQLRLRLDIAEQSPGVLLRGGGHDDDSPALQQFDGRLPQDMIILDQENDGTDELAAAHLADLELVEFALPDVAGLDSDAEGRAGAGLRADLDLMTEEVG